MTEAPAPAGASLALRSIAVGSCLRFGVVAGTVAALIVFTCAFLAWLVVVPGIEQAVAAAFAGSESLLHGALGPGTGAAVAVVLAVLAAATVIVLSAVVPLFYDLAARRTGGVGIVLAPES